MTPRIACLPGDGIGPEVVGVAREVLEAAGFVATWQEHPVGWGCWVEAGDPLPAATLAACRQADAVLFGAITSKPDDAAQAELRPGLQGRDLRYMSPIVRLRGELGLWANVRPVRGRGLDVVVFRENTEDLYAGFEAPSTALRDVFPTIPDGEATLRVVTAAATRRICEAAFAHAEATGRSKVTLIEKANVLRRTGGLVRHVFWETAAAHPGIAANELHVDAACARLVSDPTSFDVVVATNLFGDIFTDVAAAVGGGLPLAASANLGGRHALFEPVHGSAPDIAGLGRADPRGAVAAAAWMARHLGQADAARRIEAALAQTSEHTSLASTRAALLAALAGTDAEGAQGRGVAAAPAPPVSCFDAAVRMDK